MYNSSLMMNGQTFAVVSVSFMLMLGCASKPEVQDSEDGERSRPHSRAKSSVRPVVASDDRRMSMQMSIGYLDERVVDGVMAPHLSSMIRCFDRAGEARRYLSGQVVLKFVIKGNGSISDVHVIKNELGNYPVESCLISVGRRMVFPPPEGGRGTDFEYPLVFRSTGELPVLNGDSEDVASRVTSARDLADCGPLGPERVDAIAYVEPNGNIGSVGFVSRGPINPAAAACAEAQITKLHVGDGHPDMVVRTVFPMVIASRSAGKVESHRATKRSRRR